MFWRDLYDSTKKRTYGPRAGDYEVTDPRLKMVNNGKINLSSMNFESYELVEMIVSKVSNLFKETLDTTEEDNQKPVE